jgi:hypothetical protein
MGGFFGWYRGTRRLCWRPHHSDRPDEAVARPLRAFRRPLSNYCREQRSNASRYTHGQRPPKT